MLEKVVLLEIIFAVALVLAIAFSYLNHKYKRRWIDYYVMFLTGIGWIVLGLLYQAVVLVVIGIGFSILGYYNRDYWDEDLKKLKRKANRDELYLLRSQTDILETIFVWMIFVGVAVLIGVIAYIYIQKLIAVTL